MTLITRGNRAKLLPTNERKANAWKNCTKLHGNCFLLRPCVFSRKSADSVSPGLILGVEGSRGFHYPNLLSAVSGRIEEDETAKTGFVPLTLFI